MTGARHPYVSLAALAAMVMAAGLATAATEDVAGPAQDVDTNAGAVEELGDEATGEASEATDEPSAGDEVVAALATVGETLAQAAQATGQALATAGAAIGDAAVATGAAVGSAAAWTGRAIADGAIATADGVAFVAVNVGHGLAAAADGLGTAIAWTATGLADVSVAVGSGIAAGATWLGVATAEIAVDVGAWMGQSWPDSRQGQAIAAGSTASVAAASGAAWYTRVWKHAKYVPALAPMYTRLTRDELLDHEIRQRLYEQIEADPGIHLSELAREADVSWGTLLHHLRKLEEADLVYSEKENGKRCFFLPGQVSDEQRQILPALENDKARTIAEFYIENPSASQSEAADELGYSAALVSYHLQKLEDAGVVTRERQGRQQRVGVTQEARAVVA